MTELTSGRGSLRERGMALVRINTERGIDIAIAAALFGGYLMWLLYTALDLGYARDEGFYFHAARTYGKWFELLLENPERALTPKLVDQYWRENHEHPALMKTLFWLSERVFGSVLGERGTALRLPGMLLSAAAVAATYGFGRRAFGRAGALVAALAFACMPRVFYHSHLACFDMPITSLCLLTIYAYHGSVQRRSIIWACAAALLYGLALNTKHNAWVLPGAFGLHALSRLLPERGERLRRAHAFALLPVTLMLLLGPLLLYATWPWIWRDTYDRFVEYVKFHAEHVYYNMEYLGHTYFEPPFPRTYAPVMTLATVPSITLLLSGLGGLVWLSRSRIAARFRAGQALAESGAPFSSSHGVHLLWLLCVLTSYGPWLFSDTPIFGGTKHWMPAYPYLALFAGQGFDWLRGLLIGAFAAGPRRRALLTFGLGASVVAAPLVMTAHSHPFGLSAYTPLVGGAPGAATLGLNRTFWGYTTGSVVDFLNASAAPKTRVFLHDTAHDSFRMLQKDRRLSRDLEPWWTVAGSRLALYHHEQHMSRVEHMIWVDYGTTTPAHVAAFDGVPIVWVYARGERTAEPGP